MNKEMWNNLKNTGFDNMIYQEIVDTFIEEVKDENTRITLGDSEIIVKANNIAGMRTINFRLHDDNLLIVVSKGIGIMRYQQRIEYDKTGLIVKRTSCSAILNDDVNDLVTFDADILARELDDLGNDKSAYAVRIYKTIDYTEVDKIPDSNEGSYVHKVIGYNHDNIKGYVVKGTTIINDNDLIIPNESDVTIVNKEIINDNMHTYNSS